MVVRSFYVSIMLKRKAHADTHAHSQSLTHAHSHSLTHTHTHLHALTHTHSHSLTRTHALTRTHSHSLTFTTDSALLPLGRRVHGARLLSVRTRFNLFGSVVDTLGSVLNTLLFLTDSAFLPLNCGVHGARQEKRGHSYKFVTRDLLGCG